MIISAITIITGLLFAVVGYLYTFTLLSFIPSITLCLIGIITLILELRWNTHILLIEDYNGKKVFKLVKAQKFYSKKREKEGYYIKIEGFSEAEKVPDNKFINLNLSGVFKEVICFFKDGLKLTPCKVEFNTDNIKFISDSMIANHYQMMNVVREVVKSPTDTMQTIINIGLILCMLACIITMIYNSGKLGVNIDAVNSIVEKIDQIIGSINELMMKIEEGVGGIGGLMNNTSIPPISR